MATQADLPSVPGAANSQTTQVLDDAVATEDAVAVPKHVGLCSCPQAHTGNPHPVTRRGRQPGPNRKDAHKDDTPTATHKTYLRERAQPTKRVYSKNPFLDQDYPDRGSALHLNFTLPMTKSHLEWPWFEGRCLYFCLQVPIFQN